MFVHLHTHSDYSLQDGAQTIEQIVSRAAELDMPAVAVTDHGRAGGLLQLDKECKKKDIKPLFGIELYMAPESRLTKEKIDGHTKTSYHLTVLAKNEEGLRNIFRITSESWLTGFYYKPRADVELLQKNKEGLIVLSGCGSSFISSKIMEEDIELATNHIQLLHSMFKDDFYIEIQNHGLAWQDPLKQVLLKMSNRFSIPAVVTQDSHYQKKEDSNLHNNICKLTAGDLSFDSDQSWFKSEEEIKEMFPANEYHAIERTLEVANKCDCNWDYSKTIWPVYDLPSNETPETKLRELTEKGFGAKFGAGTQEYKDRLEYELGIIKQMGFSTYFLVVQDIVNWARNNGVMPGPGRGSAAGSLVCYCLGITEVDPIKYDLYFERFLNPSRSGTPDYSKDIPQNLNINEDLTIKKLLDVIEQN